ncbi:MAG TPA: hypothetical protein DFS52_13285 [Myxococcales bacterium]|nr:hypothetical protein [Myxococcales bacterium]
MTEEEIEKLPGLRRVREDEDTTRFVVAGAAEDLFEADAFTAAIGEAGIAVLANMKRSSPVDALTSSVQRPWWEILVPQEALEKATEIIGTRRSELKASEEDAEKAAEEEAGGAE